MALKLTEVCPDHNLGSIGETLLARELPCQQGSPPNVFVHQTGRDTAFETSGGQFEEGRHGRGDLQRL